MITKNQRDSLRQINKLLEKIANSVDDTQTTIEIIAITGSIQAIVNRETMVACKEPA